MKKYIRGKNFVGNYEIRKAIENDPTQPVRKCSSNIAKMNVFEYVYYFFKDWQVLQQTQSIIIIMVTNNG